MNVGAILDFYISIYCRELLAHVVLQDQPSSSQLLSPMYSPEGTHELIKGNHRLRIQLKQCKNSLQEKTT